MFYPLLPIGSKAPEFSMLDQEGRTVCLQDFIGKKGLVLVFYPADNTMVCTQQLCEFRDSYEGLSQKGIEVLGVNPGDWESHHQFAQKHAFPFPILYDYHARCAKRYGAIWIPGFLNRRTVYGINIEGKICFAKRGKPSVQEVLKVFL
jgi:peroxiredoxin Q/BCP